MSQDTVLASMINQAKNALNTDVDPYTRYVFAGNVIRSGYGFKALGISMEQYDRLMDFADVKSETHPIIDHQASFVHCPGLEPSEAMAMAKASG